ncbi:MAG: hypothetical protein Kow0092_35290 [Deferrisomatales bacterium]
MSDVDVASRLAHLLPHWIEHNEAHLDTYREWARRARDAGLEAALDALDQAVVEIARANEALRRAIDSLPGRST